MGDSAYAGADTLEDLQDKGFDVKAKVPPGAWQELAIEARGSRFEVFFGGKSLFSTTDPTFATAGRVALWTKSDSVTRFDQFKITVLP